MNKLRLIITLIFSLIITLEAKEKVTIQLDWLHQFQFAGYYMAKEKGFFEKENLNVEIKEFTFDTKLVKETLSRKAHYAVGKSSLIVDKLDGKDIVLLAAIYQSSPMVLISLDRSDIKSIKDLKNKNIMLTKDARTSASVNSMLISQGISLEEINFQKHSFKLEDLINGKTDAMGCYLSNEPYILKSKNIDFKVFNPSDYGFDFYGGLFFTSQKELNENPIRVRKMHRAVLEGWKYAFENIEETANLIFNKYNTQNKSLKSLIFEGEVLKTLAKVEEGKLGDISLNRVEEMKRLYLLLGLSKTDKNLKLNELIYNPNFIYLTKEEKEFIKNNSLKLLTNSNFPPFTIERDKKLTGIEIDYWRLIEKRLEANSTIQIVNNNSRANEDINKNSNYIKYAFEKEDYENTNLTQTIKIDEIKVALATLVDKPYSLNIKDLKNKKIAIGKTAIFKEKLKKEYPNIKFIEVENLNKAFELLQDQKVYGVIEKLPPLSYHITRKTISNSKISGIFDLNYEIKLNINKNNPQLLNILNKTIATITDEDREKIRDKYNSIIYEPEKDYTWTFVLISFLVTIIVVIINSNRKLNKEIKRRKIAEEELHKIANIDDLTDVYNRRKINSLIELELNREKRYKRGLSLIFFDVDNFKLINDELGHAFGDEVLKSLSSLVKENIRKTDLFGRWGGEEFVIILPETNKTQAKKIAYSLKYKITSFDFKIDRTVSCSFGVSQYQENDDADSLITRADNAMYYIKKNGKNEVKVM